MIRSFVLGSTLALVLASPVLAGPCTEQISDLQKVLASSDAGSGPTLRTGSTQPSTTSSTQPQAGAMGAAPSAMPRQVPAAGETPQTEATAAMNRMTQDKATSPQDVRAQTQGQPTASQTGAGGAAAPQDRVLQIQTALDRARTADQAGDASGCSNAVNQAKSLLGR